MTQVSNETSNSVALYDNARTGAGAPAEPAQRIAPPQPPQGLSPIAMASLIATVRRPPLLRNRKTASSVPHIHDKVLQKHAAPLAQYSSSELAFFVSHIVQRREADIIPIRVEEVREGYVALAKLARMYQHLSILQT